MPIHYMLVIASFRACIPQPLLGKLQNIYVKSLSVSQCDLSFLLSSLAPFSGLHSSIELAEQSIYIIIIIIIKLRSAQIVRQCMFAGLIDAVIN